MANGGKGLWQWVRLKLDKKSADEVRDGAKKALKDGTNPKVPEKNIGRVKRSMESLKSTALKVGAALASIWVVRQVFEYGKAVFQLGADVRAVGSQFRTVFGQSSGALGEFLEEFRRMAGLTRREAQRIAARAGSMGQGFGMAAGEAASFSRQILELSADLASFNNVPTAEAAQLVQSALIGNTEAARSLGVAFTALDVQNRALAQTGKSTAAELTQEEKALAALSVMTERAGPQIGDLARTQQDADNQAKQLAGSYNNLRETLASVLVGGVEGQTVFADLTEVFEDLTGWVEANAESIGSWVSAFITGTTAIARAIGFVVNGVRMATETIGALFGTMTVQIPIMFKRAMLEAENVVIRGVENMARPLRMLGITIGEDFIDSSVEGIQSRRAALQSELDSAQASFRDTLADIGGMGVSAPDTPSAPGAPDAPSATGTPPTGESKEAKEQREAVESLVGALREERDALQFSRWALIERSDAYRNATPEQQRMIRSTYIEIEALNAQAEAEKKAKEEKEKARLEAQRRAQSVMDGIQALEAERDQLTLNSMQLLRQSDAYQWATEAQRAYMEETLRANEALREQQKELERLEARATRTGSNITRGFQPFFEALYTGFGDTGKIMDGFVDSVQGVGAAVIGALAEGQVEYHQAQGIAKLAEGTWPPNPAAIASSLKHFAAATAFAALPAIAGGVGGSRSGGAGAQGVRNARGADGFRATGDRIGPDIIIQIDGVDPKNPRHQALVGETSRQYRQRYGGRIRVEDG